jgi:replicative DNA helicase
MKAKHADYSGTKEISNPEGRIPPYSAEAERAVLGAVLLNNEAWAIIRHIVHAEDFYNISHRYIYEAMARVINGGAQVDHVTLGEDLKQSGDLDRIGGAMAFANLTDQAGLMSNVKGHAKIVVDMAARRRMVYAAQEIVARGYTGDGDDTVEFLGSARKSIIEAASYADLSRGGPHPLDKDYMEIFKNLDSGKEPEGLIHSGLGNVDKVTGGCWPGELLIIAARPGMGKSCLAQNIGMNAALQNKRVCYLTLEDVRETIAVRNLARFSGIDAQDIRLNRVPKEQYTDLLVAANRLTNQSFNVDDASALSVSQIAQIAASEREKHGLNLLIVDLLTEVRSEGENETTKITIAARGLRDIAKEMHIPVLLVHQLNRGVESTKDKRPELGHLRQSGEIEAVARAVWFLFRPAYYLVDEDAQHRRDAELIIAKSNHGRTGLVRLYMDLGTMYVRAWDRMNDGTWPGDVDVYNVPAHFREPTRMREQPPRPFGEKDY